jgi:hypothetical protein
MDFPKLYFMGGFMICLVLLLADQSWFHASILNVDVSDIRQWIKSDNTTQQIAKDLTKICRQASAAQVNKTGDNRFSMKECQAFVIEQYVQNNITYVLDPDYSIDYSGEIIKKGYGNCRDQAVAAAALLEDSGFDKIYFLTQYAYLPGMIPNMDWVGHVCAFAISGNDYYFVNCFSFMDYVGIYQVNFDGQ